MSNASKGRAFEHEVRDMLRANGFSVTRGAGSKGQFDTPFGIVNCDLIASKCGRSNKYDLQLLLVQAKVRATGPARRKVQKTSNANALSEL